MDRFVSAIVSFVSFLAACRFAPLKIMNPIAGAVSMEICVSVSEKDTDALVTPSGCDSLGPADESIEPKRPQEEKENVSVFRILRLASGTVFGSIASIVFFVNLFFINIGTNVVEGLVRDFL
jgi:hypothetical protein